MHAHIYLQLAHTLLNAMGTWRKNILVYENTREKYSLFHIMFVYTCLQSDEITYFLRIDRKIDQALNNDELILQHH